MPIITTTHGGYTLLLGNNAFFYRFARQGDWNTAWNAAEFHQHWNSVVNVNNARDELRTDFAASGWARDVMRCDPLGCALACGYRGWQIVTPLPNQVDNHESLAQRGWRWLVAGWYLAIYAAAWRGIRNWRTAGASSFRSWAIPLLLAVVAVHTIYWTNLRMRAPLIPLLAIAAAACIQPPERPQSKVSE